MIRFIFRYFYRPMKRFVQKWIVRIYNSNAYIETSVINIINSSYRQSFKVGNGSSIRRGTIISIHSKNVQSSIIIGTNTYVGENNNLRAADGIIRIGNHCLISQGVTIVTSNHSIKDRRIITEQPWDSKRSKVIIEDGVWVGANAVILPDVTIGEGAVVGAGSIVTKDVPSYAIVAGNPSKIIKFRE